ncbi:MmcQ/YjbR family DNA-binding protein [Paraliobacillus ryukyuensis]|uniref:MmcQ/YjbR family DNA-binding protein n=1 Tax=Paraliobacillus ryukyuensis TaxID=200904 RepID=UPI0009A7C188|nr:MmcQ/YjbR family DNA-binding protein [Paraliobacillus ryukyuensis]
MCESMKQRMEFCKQVGNGLPGAKVYYREDWDAYYFDLLGKYFGLMSSEANENAIITLKGLPDENEALRHMYADIIPGYYSNKRHWNSIMLKTEVLSNETIAQMIKQSYQLVLDKFPKKVKATIIDETA